MHDGEQSKAIVSKSTLAQRGIGREKWRQENMFKAIFTWSMGFVILSLSIPEVRAQNQQLQERLAEVKQAAARNKQALAQYTWEEQQTVSIKGDVKKQQLFQVRLGSDGKPQKTEITASQQGSPGGGRRFGLRGRIIEKKKEEFEDYAHKVAALAQSYTQPEPGRLQELFQQGNLTLGAAGMPGEIQIVIHNYLKPGDTVTLVFSRSQKALRAMEISSYLSDPGDAVNISAQFVQVPGGPNHVSSMQIEGVRKQLTVNIQNSNYQRI